MINSEVPLGNLTDDDLNTFMSDYEKQEFMGHKNEIIRALLTCTDIPEISDNPLVNVATDLKILEFQVHLISPIYKIRSLLRNVYHRKVAKLRQEKVEREEREKKKREIDEAERRKKEEEEKWNNACKLVAPPLDDAEIYLSEEEYNKFIKTARDAIEAYLEKGDEYLDSTKTFDYRQWLWKINHRKEEEKLRIVAESAAKEYNQCINKRE